MLQELGQLLDENRLTLETAKEIAEDLSLELASLRNSGQISNDAFLEAGVIQGGISVLSNMLGTSIGHSEIMVHFSQIRDRAATISTSYPELTDVLS
tara:strand:+ start:396 stop:686 length:291 start_codon:yes stop_codon:yes gene_type:complete